MYSIIKSGGISGICSYIVSVEVDASRALPCFEMVGRLSGEVKEARERVRVALRNCGIELPPVAITVNLSPANVHKYGTAYDLPIAVGVVSSIGLIDRSAADNLLFIGELGLNGEIRRVSGVLPILMTARDEGIHTCIIPADNLSEALYVEGIHAIPVTSFTEVMDFLHGELPESDTSAPPLIDSDTYDDVDFADIRGQDTCKRAALIAAAGFHHLLITGPPGAGKTMIAKRISTILPPLSSEESLEVSTIYSVSGLLNDSTPYISRRPFLSPHHTTTRQALAGGGSNPHPGIVSLSHKGVLFLDELPEFSRDCLEVLREPLEDKVIQIARSRNTFTYPADFMLVAAANPCPCGYYPDRNRCNCSDNSINRYRSRISGPMRDRIDLIVSADRIDSNRLIMSDSRHSMPTVTSESMRSQVMSARQIQLKRFEGTHLNFNSDIEAGQIEAYCHLDTAEKEYMQDVYNGMGLTARSYHKILRVARTIADLDNSECIHISHLAEAICYRG